ncbi:DUF721 domain-containing protein [Roseibium aestuarii]|uniref:DUF721 domain-containing protein n=1 Tax=Roseibium aestuarii TaxID=2600299 RepID=A0ABW4JUB1_9HYPH|nr:DciA family protein [Roseibium aestuarii]
MAASVDASPAAAPRTPQQPQKPRTLADLIGKAMTPLCRKRGFASVDIVAAWPEIVGPRYGERVQPDRLIWSRRKDADGEDIAEPATLLVHTDGPTAMMLSHETGQIIERINAFFGWAAVGRIKIAQKPVMPRPKSRPRPPRPLTGEERARLDRQVEGVEDDRLREALRKLGERVIARGDAGKRS